MRCWSETTTPPELQQLGELVCGKKSGRTDACQRTLAMNLGIALDDMATAILIYRRACECGIGTRLSL
jgi:ornithine cyclodeaminase/alanine dehydrogenase-like protein (mu-crystallin family)